MPEYRRDPVSVALDGAARRLLDRVYAAPGQWTSTRLADPSPAHVARFAAEGIDILETDRPPVTGGPRVLDARTRWARAYVRALYHQHLWYSVIGGRGWRSTRRTEKRHAGALEVRIGRRAPARGVIPAGVMVSAILHPGGRPAEAAAADRAAGASTPALRDWEDIPG
jgi:hypothetical protein